MLQELETKKLYVKYSDVAFNPNDKNIEYRALVRFDKKVNQTIIPCVFITNTTFQYVKDVKTFAQELHAKMSPILFIKKNCWQRIQGNTLTSILWRLKYICFRKESVHKKFISL